MSTTSSSSAAARLDLAAGDAGARELLAGISAIWHRHTPQTPLLEPERKERGCGNDTTLGRLRYLVPADSPVPDVAWATMIAELEGTGPLRGATKQVMLDEPGRHDITYRLADGSVVQIATSKASNVMLTTPCYTVTRTASSGSLSASTGP